jgi:ferredoxin
MAQKLRVWIDQDLCTGDGLCVEIAPAVFGMHEDGLAYVKDPSWPTIFGPDGSPVGEPALQSAAGLAEFGESLLNDVVDSAEECPGECIFIDISED